MNLRIDFRAETPIFMQIVEQIQKRVLSGELKPGDQLPTVRQLAANLRVNFNTVARAYRVLDELGLISTQQGRGTFIWEPLEAADSDSLRRSALKTLARQYIQDARALNFGHEEIRQAVEEILDQQ